MERPLVRIGAKISKYEKELGFEQEATEKKKDLITRKKKKEQQWEMVRWLVEFTRLSARRTERNSIKGGKRETW